VGSTSGNSATFEFLNQVRGIDTGNGLVGCEAVYIRGKDLVGGYSFADAVTNPWGKISSEGSVVILGKNRIEGDIYLPNLSDYWDFGRNKVEGELKSVDIVSSCDAIEKVEDWIYKASLDNNNDEWNFGEDLFGYLEYEKGHHHKKGRLRWVNEYSISSPQEGIFYFDHLRMGGKVNVKVGSLLTLFVKGDFEVLGKSKVNYGGDPASLIVVVGGDVRICGKSSFSGTIISKGDVRICGRSRFKGSIISKRLFIDGHNEALWDVNEGVNYFIYYNEWGTGETIRYYFESGKYMVKVTEGSLAKVEGKLYELGITYDVDDVGYFLFFKSNMPLSELKQELLPVGASFVGQFFTKSNDDRGWIPNPVLLVRYKDDVTKQEVIDFNKRIGVKSVEVLSWDTLIFALTVTADNVYELMEKRKEYEESDLVEWVDIDEAGIVEGKYHEKVLNKELDDNTYSEYNYMGLTGFFTRNTPDVLDFLVGYKNESIEFPIYGANRYNRPVRIGVIGYGVYDAHEDLRHSLCGFGKTFVEGDKNGYIPNYIRNPSENDNNQHEIWITGLIAADSFNHKGVWGLTFGSSCVVPIQDVYRRKTHWWEEGEYINVSKVSWTVKGINYAKDVVDILNISWKYEESNALRDAILDAAKKILIVASAGNEDKNRCNFPANLAGRSNGILCVGAVSGGN